MKDHEIAKIVNDLREIGQEFGQMQQLRSRISGYITPIFHIENEKTQKLVNTITNLIKCAEDNLDNGVSFELCVQHYYEGKETLAKWKAEA